MADNPEKNKEEVELTENEVWDVIEFARALVGTYNAGYLTPELINARMRDINLNPMAATEDELNRALVSPKDSEQELRDFSQDFELRSMVYKRIISYLSNMLSFDITYTSNAEPKDYNTPKYRKDAKAIENFLDGFDYRKELSIAVREMLRNDAYFACIRDVGSKIVLQELPPDYCKITGRWEGGFLFSFNMYWFMLAGVDINMYPDFFKKKYKEIWKKANSTKPYIPSLPPEMRGSTWIYWVDVPVDVGVCFKLTPELATRLPYFTPLFNDLIIQSLMRNLQKSASMAAASKMIVGSVPMLSRDIKATVKDAIAVSPDLLGKFMALVKSAISEAIKVAAAPLEDMKAISFDSENDLYDSYLKTTLASSGINTNLIFTSDVKPNVLETQLSLNTDEQMMTSLYEQFNLLMDFLGSKVTKNFKFRFSFEGTDFFLNRQQRLESVMTVFNQGVILPQKIAAALGMKPHVLRRQMEESAAMDFVGMLTPPQLEAQMAMAEINGKLQMKMQEQAEKSKEKVEQQKLKTTAETEKKTTATGEPAKPGRPQKSVSEISEETEQTRTEGSNLGRGGKV